MSIAPKTSPMLPIFMQAPFWAAKQGAVLKSLEDLAPAATSSLHPVHSDDDGGHFVDIIV